MNSDALRKLAQQYGYPTWQELQLDFNKFMYANQHLDKYAPTTRLAFFKEHLENFRT